MKVYPVSETELGVLRLAAWSALFIIGIPFLIIEVLSFVRRLERETNFETPDGSFVLMEEEQSEPVSSQY